MTEKDGRVDDPVGESGGDESRVLTVPNLLSTARLLCVPVFLWLLLDRHDRYGAGLLLAFLGITDWVDGFVARRLGQVSSLGKVLDPVADRLLLGAGVVGILIDGSVPAWVGLAVLGREALVSLAVLGLAGAGARRIEVQWVGKAGTCALMIGLPLYLAANRHGGAPWHELARPLAWTFTLPGLVLSWWAAFTYVPLALAALREGRAAGSAAS